MISTIQDVVHKILLSSPNSMSNEQIKAAMPEGIGKMTSVTPALSALAKAGIIEHVHRGYWKAIPGKVLPIKPPKKRPQAGMRKAKTYTLAPVQPESEPVPAPAVVATVRLHIQFGNHSLYISRAEATALAEQLLQFILGE